MLSFAPRGIIFSDATVVFTYDDYFHFGILQSSVHETWLRRQASSMRTDIRYTPTDCFQTFPFPQTTSSGQLQLAQKLAEAYYEHRRQTMMAHGIGLTATYGLFHDASCTDSMIGEMRRLHAEMDDAVVACYGWQDIDLSHGYHLNDRKRNRFMPSPEAQREIFSRLLALNRRIAEQEAAEGLTSHADSSDEEGEAESDDD